MRAATLLLALALATAAIPVAAEEWNTPESRARWAELSHALFGAQARLETSDRVTLEAPPTALDAALVPVSIQVAPAVRLKTLDLVIDQNPAPLAATVTFGPAGDPRHMSFRVRVDGFTNVHAVAVTDDGKLFQTATFVQAAGGCSAPMAGGTADAASRMGEMRMKFSSDAALGDAPEATLMIRHPNFNGMQMDQATHTLTPARFIKSILVTRGDQTVFAMTSDISLSTNPVIEFLFRPEGTGSFDATVVDSSGATWTKRFDAPPGGRKAS